MEYSVNEYRNTYLDKCGPFVKFNGPVFAVNRHLLLSESLIGFNRQAVSDLHQELLHWINNQTTYFSFYWKYKRDALFPACSQLMKHSFDFWLWTCQCLNFHVNLQTVKSFSLLIPSLLSAIGLRFVSARRCRPQLSISSIPHLRGYRVKFFLILLIRSDHSVNLFSHLCMPISISLYFDTLWYGEQRNDSWHIVFIFLHPLISSTFGLPSNLVCIPNSNCRILTAASFTFNKLWTVLQVQLVDVPGNYFK